MMSSLSPSILRRAGVLLAVIASCAPLDAQNESNPNRGRGSGPQGDARQRMWYAPTEADWKKPVLIQFQRTWEDAVAVARETRKPILVCINMDGEIASEHYAGIRYRQPEIAKLYKDYVCVIASTDRHNERDYDEQGRRIPCPRFGCVTCGEHIAIEPFLYEKFLDGERVAPRHIMVEVVDGEPRETYDVYYAMDTKSVFDLIETGIAKRTIQPLTIDRGDRSIVDRVASRDAVDRTAVEKAWQSADAATRKAMLETAAAQGTDVPLDLLRLALFDVDPQLAKSARTALAQSDRREALWLIGEALRTPMATDERQTLLAALDRLGQKHRHAKTLAVVHRGLGANVKSAVAGGTYRAPKEIDIDRLISAIEKSEAAAAQAPVDPAAKVALAESRLRMAVDPKSRSGIGGRRAAQYQRILYEEARQTALEAIQLGAKGWRVESVLALTAYYLGDLPEAYRRTEAAIADMPKNAEGYNAIATIALFGQRRLGQLRRAMRSGEQWPAQWLTDVHSAYSVLADHPLGTEEQAIAHFDLLADLRAGRRADSALAKSLKRFSDSTELHARQRFRWMFQKGSLGMEKAYAAMADKPAEHGENIRYFAGLASLDTAEALRKRGRQGRAKSAYDRALATFEQYAREHPESRNASTHCLALVLAGRARVAYERGELSAAVDDLERVFRVRPDMASARDGLNLSAIDTAKSTRVELTRAAEGDDGAKSTLARLQKALDALPPAAFEMPAFERPAAGRGIQVPENLRNGGRRRPQQPGRSPGDRGRRGRDY